MYFRFLTIVFVLILSASGMAQDNKGYIISGRIHGIGNTKVLLGNKPKGGHSAAFKVRYTDSCFSKNDYFVFKGQTDEPTFCSIEIPGVSKGWFSFIIENTIIQITGYKDSLYSSKITGSPQTNVYNHYKQDVYHPLAMKLNTIGSDIERLRKMNDTTEIKKLEQAFLIPYIKERETNLYRLIENNPSNFGALFELSVSQEDPDSLKKYYAKLSDKLKESTLGKKTQYKLFEYPKLISLKKPLPDFSMPDSANRIWNISEFHGKYVLEE